MTVKPTLQALVLAERVYSLEDGRKMICGTFTKIVVKKRGQIRTTAEGKPMIAGGSAGSPWAYISLTGVADNTVLQLQFVSLKKNKPIFQTSVSLHGNDRLATVELALPLPPILVNTSGGYAFDVVCDGEILGTWRVEVEVVNGDNEDSDSNDDSDNVDDTD